MNSDVCSWRFSLRQSGTLAFSVVRFCARERKNEKPKIGSTMLRQALGVHTGKCANLFNVANAQNTHHRGSPMSLLPSATIAEIARYDGQIVTLAGWVASKTGKGKLVFIRLRDGSGVIQCVVFKKNGAEEVFAAAQKLTPETPCRITE